MIKNKNISANKRRSNHLSNASHNGSKKKSINAQGSASPFKYINVIRTPSSSPEKKDKKSKYFEKKFETEANNENRRNRFHGQHPGGYRHKQLRQMFNKNYYKQLVERKPSIEKIIPQKFQIPKIHYMPTEVQRQSNRTEKKGQVAMSDKQERILHQNLRILNHESIFEQQEQVSEQHSIIYDRKQNKQIQILQNQVKVLEQINKTLNQENEILRNKSLKFQQQLIQQKNKPKAQSLNPSSIRNQISHIESVYKQKIKQLQLKITSLELAQKVCEEKLGKIIFERYLKISDNFKKTNMIGCEIKPVVGDTEQPIESRNSSHRYLPVSLHINHGESSKKSTSSEERHKIMSLGKIKNKTKQIHEKLQNCNVENFDQLAHHMKQFIIKENQSRKIGRRLHYLENIMGDVLESRTKYREIQKIFVEYLQRKQEEAQGEKASTQLLSEYIKVIQSGDQKMLQEWDMDQFDEFSDEIGAIIWVKHVKSIFERSMLGLQQTEKSLNREIGKELGSVWEE